MNVVVFPVHYESSLPADDMPRAFSDSERQKIRAALVDAGREHFGRYGYRKANVADIARDVGIGKGSVYLFFDSKAELLAAVAAHVEEENRAILLREMAEEFESAGQRMARLLRLLVTTFETEPILQLMAAPEELKAFFLELPEETQEALRQSDLEFYDELVTDWVERRFLKPIPVAQFVGLLHALFGLTLNRHLVDPEVYPDVVDRLIASLAETLTP